ncbi:DUF5672 family protein [Novosphingobium profundi]|uniref:DUF5672 family protein n=1 Tax=Novosphingobium profundi TaxID=1774954 RepID=UPI00299F12AE|nr:DUF5672 family protein [Novosphingobium profundi]
MTSVNLSATIRALEVSLEQIAFGQCLLFTDARPERLHPSIRIVPVDRLTSSAAYSQFLLNRLVDYVTTSHCLVAQWDGHVLDATRWQSEFLEYDYIGASWPQFDDGHDVGNGGFSLRSRRLMELCRAPDFEQAHPEDLAIGRTNRAWLEAQGLRFAPRELADAFSAERRADVRRTFGYHGAFRMPDAIGPERFWDVYKDLDDIGTVRHDFFSIARDMWPMRNALARISRLAADCLLLPLRRKARKS